MNALLWALVAAVIWGFVPVLEKLGLTQSAPMVAVFARSIGVFLGALVCGVWWSPWKALGNVPLRAFLLLALGGFLASVVGQLAFYHALKTGHVSQVTPIAGTYPLVAVVLGWVLLREPMTAGRVVGAIFIGAGVLLLRR